MSAEVDAVTDGEQVVVLPGAVSHDGLPKQGAEPREPVAGPPAPAPAPLVIDLPAAHREIERRRATSENRRSWAANLPPFQLDPGVGVEAAQVKVVAEARRAERTRSFVHRLVVTDAVVALLVMGACLQSLERTRGPAMLFAVLASATWVGMLALLGGYERGRVGDGPEELSAVLKAAVTVVALMGLVAYSFELIVPRRDVLVAIPVTAALTAVGRYSWRKWLHRRRKDGIGLARTLVVGDPVSVSDTVRHLRREAYHGYEVVGACVPEPSAHAEQVSDTRLLGMVAEVPQVVVDHDVDTVLVVGSQLTGRPLRRLSWALEHTGAELMVSPGVVEVTGPYVSLHPVAGLSLLKVERPSQRSGRLVAKAVLDRTLGIALFLAAAPVIGVAALVVRLTSPGPAFFAQERVGRDGELFTMWKLRSMVQDADRQVIDLRDSNESDGLLFKMRTDPRITPVGRILRRTSLDELPQLWNVVRGDMSLVGPRPPLPREFAEYHDDVHRRLRVKPGLTGLWQVSGRSDLSWEDSVRLDLRYVDNWSPAMDLQILWKTVRAVVTGSGAY